MIREFSWDDFPSLLHLSPSPFFPLLSRHALSRFLSSGGFVLVEDEGGVKGAVFGVVAGKMGLVLHLLFPPGEKEVVGRLLKGAEGVFREGRCSYVVLLSPDPVPGAREAGYGERGRMRVYWKVLR